MLLQLDLHNRITAVIAASDLTIIGFLISVKCINILEAFGVLL